MKKFSEESRKIGSRAGHVGARCVTVPWRAAARAPSPQPPRVLLCLHKPHIQIPPSRAPARAPCHSVSVFLFIIISQGIIKEHYPQANAPLPSGPPHFTLAPKTSYIFTPFRPLLRSSASLLIFGSSPRRAESVAPGAFSFPCSGYSHKGNARQLSN